MEIDRFHELLLLKRAMSIREKSRKHSQLTKEIRLIGRTDYSKIVSLGRDLESLKYNPSSPPVGGLNDEEIKRRCDGLLETLSDREMSLLLKQEMADAQVCGLCHALVKNFLSILNLSSPDNALPLPPAPPLSSRFRFSCGSHPITLLDGKCAEQNSLSSGVFYGELTQTTLFGTEKKAVAIKVGREGRDLTHECRVLRGLNEKSVDASKQFLHVLSLEMGQDTNDNRDGCCSRDYLVLEDFGHDLRVVMRTDNQSFRKKILVPLLLKLVQDLHHENVMHGDLKPQNVLIKSVGIGSYQLKLCDFDSARVVGEALSRDVSGGLKFTSSWVSPEVFHAAYGASKANPISSPSKNASALTGQSSGDDSLLIVSSLSIDLFSLGLMIEVLCRRSCDSSSTALPSVAEDSSYDELHDLLSNQERLYEKMESLHGGEKSQTEVVKQLLRLDPSSRGDISQILGQYQSIVEGTTGILRQKTHDQKIIELNELIVRLSEMVSTSGSDKLSRSDLEGCMSDQMTVISSLLDMKTSEIIDRLCGEGEEGRVEMLQNLRILIKERGL